MYHENFSQNFGHYLFFNYHTTWPYFSISVYQLLRIRFSCIMKKFSPNFGPYLFYMHHVSWLLFSIWTIEKWDFMYHEHFTVKFWTLCLFSERHVSWLHFQIFSGFQYPVSRRHMLLSHESISLYKLLKIGISCIIKIARVPSLRVPHCAHPLFYLKIFWILF